MRIDAAPNWVITPYHSAASRASRLWDWSVRMSRSELSAINSQQNMKLMTLDAAGTTSNVRTKIINIVMAVLDAIAPRAYPTQYTHTAAPTNELARMNNAPRGSSVSESPVMGSNCAVRNGDEGRVTRTWR